MKGVGKLPGISDKSTNQLCDDVRQVYSDDQRSSSLHLLGRLVVAHQLVKIGGCGRLDIFNVDKAEEDFKCSFSGLLGRCIFTSVDFSSTRGIGICVRWSSAMTTKYFSETGLERNCRCTWRQLGCWTSCHRPGQAAIMRRSSVASSSDDKRLE